MNLYSLIYGSTLAAAACFDKKDCSAVYSWNCKAQDGVSRDCPKTCEQRADVKKTCEEWANYYAGGGSADCHDDPTFNCTDNAYEWSCTNDAGISAKCPVKCMNAAQYGVNKDKTCLQWKNYVPGKPWPPAEPTTTEGVKTTEANVTTAEKTTTENVTTAEKTTTTEGTTKAKETTTTTTDAPIPQLSVQVVPEEIEELEIDWDYKKGLTGSAPIFIGNKYPRWRVYSGPQQLYYYNYTYMGVVANSTGDSSWARPDDLMKRNFAEHAVSVDRVTPTDMVRAHEESTYVCFQMNRNGRTIVKVAMLNDSQTVQWSQEISEENFDIKDCKLVTFLDADEYGKREAVGVIYHKTKVNDNSQGDGLGTYYVAFDSDGHGKKFSAARILPDTQGVYIGAVMDTEDEDKKLRIVQKGCDTCNLNYISVSMKDGSVTNTQGMASANRKPSEAFDVAMEQKQINTEYRNIYVVTLDDSNDKELIILQCISLETTCQPYSLQKTKDPAYFPRTTFFKNKVNYTLDFYVIWTNGSGDIFGRVYGTDYEPKSTIKLIYKNTSKLELDSLTVSPSGTSPSTDWLVVQGVRAGKQFNYFVNDKQVCQYYYTDGKFKVTVDGYDIKDISVDVKPVMGGKARYEDGYVIIDGRQNPRSYDVIVRSPEGLSVTVQVSWPPCETMEDYY